MFNSVQHSQASTNAYLGRESLWATPTTCDAEIEYVPHRSVAWPNVRNKCIGSLEADLLFDLEEAAERGPSEQQ